MQVDHAEHWTRFKLPARVPGLTGQIWSDTMKDTLFACFADYHTDESKKATFANGGVPEMDYRAALRWIKGERQRYKKSMLDMCKVIKEIEAVGATGRVSKDGDKLEGGSEETAAAALTVVAV